MILFSHEITGENTVKYVARADEPLGECEFTYGGYEMKMLSIDCDDDIIIEGLMRASMNYGANRMMYICTVNPDMLCPALNRLGFTAGNLTVEIPEALTKSDCKCNNEPE